MKVCIFRGWTYRVNYLTVIDERNNEQVTMKETKA